MSAEIVKIPGNVIYKYNDWTDETWKYDEKPIFVHHLWNIYHHYITFTTTRKTKHLNTKWTQKLKVLRSSCTKISFRFSWDFLKLKSLPLIFAQDCIWSKRDTLKSFVGNTYSILTLPVPILDEEKKST